MVLVLLLSVRVFTAPYPVFAGIMLAIALATGLLALWEAGSRYVWREDDEHRTPRPWAAFTAAISILCSAIAGLSLTFQDLPDILVDFTRM